MSAVSAQIQAIAVRKKCFLCRVTAQPILLTLVELVCATTGALDVLVALHIQVDLLPGLLNFCLAGSRLLSSVQLLLLAVVQTIKIDSSELRQHITIVCSRSSGCRLAHAQLLRGAVEEQLRVVECLLAFGQLAERA